MGSEFNKALADFSSEFAYGAQVRHLAEMGVGISDIKKRLDYPASDAQIGQAMWKYLVKEGKILLEDPANLKSSKKVSYEQCRNEYGQTYFKQVISDEISIDPADYVKCGFGKEKYKDPKGLKRRLELLTKPDREYVEILPWPLKDVWHIRDERMQRIAATLHMECSEIQGGSMDGTDDRKR